MFVKRKPVSKKVSSSKFRRNVSRTKKVNLSIQPQRGGWRL